MKTQMTVLAMTVLMGCSACGKPAASLPSECAPDNGHFLYIFGDSITYGLDGNSYADMYGCAKGYRVVNMAVGGTSIEFGNQYAMIMAHQRNWLPGDLVIFSPGENDAVLYAHDAAHVADYQSKMTDILAIAATKQTRVIIGTPNYSCDEPRFGPNSDRDIYANITRNLITAQAASNIKLVDFTALYTPTAIGTYDCLHPNAVGNHEMAAILEAQTN